MTEQEDALAEEVALLVRGAMQAIAPAWRRATVRFAWDGGCFSTTVSYAAAHDPVPVDAVAHRALFVRLQQAGRRLPYPGSSGGCDVDIDAVGTHAARVKVRAASARVRAGG